MKFLRVVSIVVVSFFFVGCADFTEGFENGIRLGQALDSIQ
jgi:hypothetical protein